MIRLVVSLPILLNIIALICTEALFISEPFCSNPSQRCGTSLVSCRVAFDTRRRRLKPIVAHKSSARSGDIEKTGLKSKRRKRHKLQVKRMKKSEMNDLVRGLGLTPVSSLKEENETANVTDGGAGKESLNGRALFEDYFPIYELSLRTRLEYAQKGHTVLRSFLPTSIIKSLKTELLPFAESHAIEAWRQKVEIQLAESADNYYRLNARTIADSLKTAEECQDMLESLGIQMNDVPFMQHFNTWRNPNSHTPTVTDLCLSPYFARTASILLDSPTIRLYQDSLFHKRPGDGWTPYHSDARMAPFDTSKMLTFWIPLQRVPHPNDGGTGLLFVDGSHCDFALPYWNGVEGAEYDRLEKRYHREDRLHGESHHMPLDMGDVTVHNGWTLHCAAAADMMGDGEDRYAFAVSYVDGRAEVRESVGGADKGDKEDMWSFRSWLNEVKPRTQFRHPSVPMVWPIEKRQ